MAVPKMIQLRHVPDDLHRKLKARAALAGLRLSDYLLQEVRRVAERPTIAELRSRLATDPLLHPGFLRQRPSERGETVGDRR